MRAGNTFSFLCAIAVLLPVACRREALAQEHADPRTTVQGCGTMDFVVSAPSKAVCSGLDISFQEGDMISINGNPYPVVLEEGRTVVKNVAKDAGGSYSCIFPALGSFLDHASDKNYKVPPVQFYVEGSFGRDAMPLICHAAVQDDNAPAALHFTPAMGVMVLPVSAPGAEIRTIKVENNAFDPKDGLTYMSGRFAPYDASGAATGTITAATCRLDASSATSTAMSPYVVLLCNGADGRGVVVDGTRNFYIVVPARTYDKGFTVTITDNAHLSRSFSTSGATTIPVGGAVTMQPVQYTPEEGLLFSEHFDAMVYGGDPVGYRAGVCGYRGYLPRMNSGQSGLFSDQYCSGLERNVYYGSNTTAAKDSDGASVKETTPGSDIYANWHTNATSDSDAVFGMDDIDTRVMSESYIRSRGMWDWCPSRIIEYQGYVLVGKSASITSVISGMTSTGSPQGSLKTPALKNLEGTADIKLSFRIAKGFGAPSQSIRIACQGGGGFVSCSCAGSATSISPDARYAYITDASSLDSAAWSIFEAEIAGACSNTHFQFYSPDGSDKAKTTTFYLDDIQVWRSEIHGRSTVSGTVNCGGVPVAGAAVSDGYSVVKTDAQGRYSIDANPSARFVFISTPSGYETARAEGDILPGNFRAIDPKTSCTVDFQLRSVDQSRYTLFVMADSHVLAGASSYNANDDRSQYKNIFIPAAQRFVAAEGCPVYGIHLGDMTQCEYWAKHYSISDYYSDTRPLGIPVFHTIGNHDHDYNNKAYGDSHLVFESVLGPRYYSFNIGTQHFVVMDNITVSSGTASSGYVNSFSYEQMSWLRQDVAAMPSGISQVVVCTHAPILNKAGTGYSMNGTSATELFNILSGYEVVCLVGHNHYDRIDIGTRGGKKVTEFVHPSLAGVAWLHTLCNDGTPRSAGIYRISGSSIVRTLYAFDSGSENDYTIYNRSVTDMTGTERMTENDPYSTVKAILVNFPNAYDCTFEESGGAVGTVVPKGAYDPDFRHFVATFGVSGKKLGEWQYPTDPGHLWRYIPADPASTITIKARDAFGTYISKENGQFITTKVQ